MKKQSSKQNVSYKPCLLYTSLNVIEESIKLEQEIKLIPGVVEVGLFNNIADKVIIGKENSTEIISRRLNKK